MAHAANKFRLLYLTSNKSDIEYKIMLLNQKRMSLADQTGNLAANYANNIFQTDQHSDLYNGILPGALPGFVNPGVNQDPIPTGNYEAELLVIQSMDKELEVEAKKLEVFHEAAKTEIESVEKILKKNIEKDYKTFG